MLTVQNEALLELLADDYSATQLRSLIAFLTKEGTFRFRSFANGLFPAAGFNPKRVKGTGYEHVWVRDNFYVAYAHYLIGKDQIALKNARALATFFKKHQHRFDDIICGKKDPGNPMNRPHIRFGGRQLNELPTPWSHAQNDALGYFLWFFSKLIVDRAFKPTDTDLQLLARFPAYFEAIAYWKDADNGHWEERPKIEASSIGVVVAALQMLQKALESLPSQKRPASNEQLQHLIASGRNALGQILPAECVQPGKRRQWDAALLFLIYPLQVVGEKMADQILSGTEQHLLGDHGIRRYLGDSYWAADYKKHLRRNHSINHDLKKRDTLWRPGQEAQWCIFDPTVSVIYGEKFRSTNDARYRKKQIHHLNRALGQLTDAAAPSGPFRCPEAYYLENGRYIPTDHTPLLWTQANLLMALHKGS